MSAIDTFWEFFAVAVGLLVVLGGLAATFLRGRGGATKDLPRERPTTPSAPAPTADEEREDRAEGSVDTLPGPTTDDTVEETLPPVTVPEVERPEAPQTRLQRLRARLARSNTALGQGLLALLSRGDLDEAAWEDVEDTLLTADLGVEATTEPRRLAAHQGQGPRQRRRGDRPRLAARGAS